MHDEDNCIFCKIIRKEIPKEIHYEDDEIIVFDDIKPNAPIHLLIVTKKHIPSVNDLKETDRGTMGSMFFVAKHMAEVKGVKDSGYRLVVNTGKDSDMVVHHIHMHLLGGKFLGGKMVVE